MVSQANSHTEALLVARQDAIFHPIEIQHGEEFVVEKPKIRVIKNNDTKQEKFLKNIRASVFSKIYNQHLKKLSLVQRIVVLFWSILWPIYVKNVLVILKSKNAKRWRRLLRLEEYTRSKKAERIELAPSVNIDTLMPRVFPDNEQSALRPNSSHFCYPSIYVAILNNAQIYGATNFILTPDGMVFHDLYDFKSDYTSEELHGRAEIDAESNHIRWLCYDDSPDKLPAAAAFVDACAGNYAHWLTEVLPRLALFCRDKRFQSVPLVVNDGLHENIMESLFLVSGSEREIFVLPPGRALDVDKMYLTSVSGYVPFDRRSDKLLDHSHGKFSSTALQMVRETMLAFLPHNKKSWPAKIFLRRSSSSRRLTNEAGVEKLLADRGYVIVETEKMTFLQQVALFKSASTVISASGSALANAIFCKPGTKVVVFMAKHQKMIYRYWCEMLTPIGIDVSYVIGKLSTRCDLGIHSDFAVETENVLAILQAIGDA